MLIGILKDKDILYYFYCNKDKNNFSWYVKKYCDNVVSVLDSSSAIKIVNNLFDNNLSFLEKKDDYYIFLDSVDNKRYFKDNVEDFNMFFIHNGVDALEFVNDKNDNSKHKKIVKKFNLKDNVVFICGTVLLITIVSPIGSKLYNMCHKIVEPYNVSIDYDKINTMISHSDCLSDDEKTFLCNEDYLSDVLKYSPSVRNYSLNEKFSNIDIDSFSKDEYDYCIGYYSPIELNKLYVRDDCLNYDDNYYDIVAHEFIHLTQANYSKYSYVHEACAEMFSYEYYDTKLNSYSDFVKRVKILMEIIGPKPILQCNFDSDDSIEESVRKYLDEDDAIALLDCLKTTGTEYAKMSGVEIKDLNDKVDDLLSKMYFNKTGNNIMNDKIINLIYSNDEHISNRYYFNTKKEGFYNPTNIGETLSVNSYNDIDDLIKSNRASKYRWYSNQYYSEEEYSKMDEDDHHNCIGFYYEMADGITYDFYAEDEKAYLYNGVRYSEDELINNGLIYGVYNVIDNYEISDPYSINPNKKDALTVIYDNGTRFEIKYDDKNKCWSGEDVMVYFPVFEKSIYEKFPEQFSEIDVIENENHIRK